MTDKNLKALRCVKPLIFLEVLMPLKTLQSIYFFVIINLL
ncbi:hypothetical protein CCAN2_1110009 [Capnocytophaga canimorsus]|nr:hypothetical protein CCAN2_1110009 [Capnocytophaga canimorsus]